MKNRRAQLNGRGVFHLSKEGLVDRSASLCSREYLIGNKRAQLQRSEADELQVELAGARVLPLAGLAKLHGDEITSSPTSLVIGALKPFLNRLRQRKFGTPAPVDVVNTVRGRLVARLITWQQCHLLLCCGVKCTSRHFFSDMAQYYFYYITNSLL